MGEGNCGQGGSITSFHLSWTRLQVFNPMEKINPSHFIQIYVPREKSQLCHLGVTALLTEFPPFRVCVCLLWTDTECHVRSFCIE